MSLQDNSFGKMYVFCTKSAFQGISKEQAIRIEICRILIKQRSSHVPTDARNFIEKNLDLNNQSLDLDLK